MADRDLLHLHPLIFPYVGRLITDAASLGLRVFVDDIWRSPADQLANWKKGRDAKGNPLDPVRHRGIVTWAKPGQSAHENVNAAGKPASLAFDIALYNRDGRTLDWNGYDDLWDNVHNIAREYVDADGKPALELGVDWPKPKTDPAHFQLANWKNYRSQ